MSFAEQIMFSRAEALHAHGYTRNACKLAIELAEEMLDNPPELNNPPPSNLSNRVSQTSLSTPGPNFIELLKYTGHYW